MAALTGNWQERLSPQYKMEYYRKLYDFVMEEYRTQVVYPPGNEIFSALELTPPENIKAVILGQDPYHEEGQAHGLSFSVHKGVRIPPSLVNIYKEMSEDLHCPVPTSGDLTNWAKQGVLLLNAVLTVRCHAAGSHANKGWEQFTDAIIKEVEKEDRPIVYLLWGRWAQNKKGLITNPKHIALCAAHPSPFSAYNGFFGCRHFSKANAFLTEHGQEPIHWDDLE